jgi:hypothetical protein
VSEYAKMMQRRREAAVRTLVDDVVYGFIALSDDDRVLVAERLKDHFRPDGHSLASIWEVRRVR